MSNYDCLVYSKYECPLSKQLGTSLGPRPKINPSADHFQYHTHCSGSNLDRMRSQDETSLEQANENLDGYYYYMVVYSA